jgi:hypothetical protein
VLKLFSKHLDSEIEGVCLPAEHLKQGVSTKSQYYAASALQKLMVRNTAAPLVTSSGAKAIWLLQMHFSQSRLP